MWVIGGTTWGDLGTYVAMWAVPRYLHGKLDVEWASGFVIFVFMEKTFQPNSSEVGHGKMISPAAQR